MKEKVILDKKKFLAVIDNFDSIHEFEITELKNIPVLKVKPASLDDQIRARELSTSSFVKNMFGKGDKNIESFHPKTVFEIEIFNKCVTDPKFTMEEVIRISKKYPELINKVCAFALGIKPDFNSLED